MSELRRSFLALAFAILALQVAGCDRAADLEADGTSFRHQRIDAKGPQDPWGKGIGDLDGDGRLDLIVGGHAGGGLVWYRNPDWHKQAISGENHFSTDHEVADIDRDGRNDVVSLLSTGLVWFKGPTWEMHWIDRRGLHDIEIADLNGDGRPDIAARGQSAFGAGKGGGDRVVLYVQGEGRQWVAQTIGVPAGEGLAVADIDGDGRVDIALNGLWLGREAGSEAWTAHRYSASWNWPHTVVAVHDIDGDSRLDIVLAPSELAGTRYRISWFQAPADRRGEWHEHVIDGDVETVHHFVAVADVDLDGRPDVLSAEMHQGEPPHEVKAYLNGGNGQWHKQSIARSGSHNMRIADIDDDGDTDLFGANWSGDDQAVELWLNQACSSAAGCPAWRRRVVDAERPGKAVFVNAADLNGDGRTDLAAGGFWYRNPGHPARAWTRTPFGAPAHDAVALRDFDADGDIDALATRWREGKPDAGLVYLENAGDGSFRPKALAVSGAGDFLQGVAIADFQGSGRPQVALSWHAPGKGVQLLAAPQRPADAGWSLANLSDFSQDEALSAGDIDRDGRTDLLLGTVWLRNEAGGSWRRFALDEALGKPDRNRLADLDGNGRLDAVVGFEAISKPGALVWYEQGVDTPLVWTRHAIATVIGPMSLDVADMDRDGDLDVIVGEHNLEDPSSARLLVFENADGKGRSWREQLVHRGDEHHDGALAVDMDGDGDLDIVSVGWGHNRVVWYENLHHARGGLP